MRCDTTQLATLLMNVATRDHRLSQPMKYGSPTL